MNSQPLSLDDGLFTRPKRRPVLVQVEEVPLTSPTAELSVDPTHGVVEIVGKTEDDSVDYAESVLKGLGLHRPRSGDGHRKKRYSRPHPRRRSSSLSSLEGDDLYHTGPFLQSRPLVNLPHLGGDDASVSVVPRTSNISREDRPSRRGGNGSSRPKSSAAAPPAMEPFSSLLWPRPSQLLAQALNGPCGIVPPLTPPEDLDSFKWDTPLGTASSEGVRTVPNVEPNRSRGRSQGQTRTSSSSRPSEIQMPDPSNIARDESNRSNWLGRACQYLVGTLGDSPNQQQFQMVVQGLPSQSKSTSVKPVFEKVVEDIQTQFSLPPYITITHAVSQVISMDEVPASPPATPNTNSTSDDYFQDQTIFTHAAVVPAYHSPQGPSHSVIPRPSNIIAAPSSIQISILERYIPPSTPREVEDFFTLSRRSYLADRLLELSSNDGSLLLVYPTQKGSSTFATRYIGPVIEPFLRQFILLNGLYTDVAIELGRMAAVSTMKSFEDMQIVLSAMCQTLGQRAPSRGLPSRYEIVHAEIAEVVLDRDLWREWYIEQEQPRLRQNLVDYHKAGGRMPARSGQIEVTPGMLAREVVDGIRQSREAAGEAPIEVGVFVIRRTMV